MDSVIHFAYNSLEVNGVNLMGTTAIRMEIRETDTAVFIHIQAQFSSFCNFVTQEGNKVFQSVVTRAVNVSGVDFGIVVFNDFFKAITVQELYVSNREGNRGEREQSDEYQGKSYQFLHRGSSSNFCRGDHSFSKNKHQL